MLDDVYGFACDVKSNLIKLDAYITRMKEVSKGNVGDAEMVSLNYLMGFVRASEGDLSGAVTDLETQLRYENAWRKDIETEEI